jgi:flagellar hook-associated protein FlgK
MSDWSYIYGEINEKIHANGIKAISGELLNEVLTKMIEAVDGNLPEAGKGLNDIAGTFMRDLSIDGKYSSYYNANAGENDYTRVCLLRHHDFAKYNNIIIAVGFSRNIDIMSDLIFVNVGGATPTIKTLTTSNAFFLETTADGNAYLCLKKETNINTQFNCAFSILMASTNTGEAMESGHLNNFEFYTVEIPATGTIIAPVRISDATLFIGPAPSNETINGNLEWCMPNLQRLKIVTLSSATNTITLPNGGNRPFSMQVKVIQDATGSRGLTFVMDDGNGGTTNIKNPSEVDFSVGSANQSCIATLLYDGNGSWWIEATSFVD